MNKVVKRNICNFFCIKFGIYFYNKVFVQQKGSYLEKLKHDADLIILFLAGSLFSLTSD